MPERAPKKQRTEPVVFSGRRSRCEPLAAALPVSRPLPPPRVVVAPQLPLVSDQHHHAAVSATMAQWTAARAGGVLVNLDSHDDLGCPPRSKLSAVQTGALLASRDPAALAAFDIGTWILPLAAHGALSSVVWVTQWGRIPSTAFTATLLLEHDGSLRVTGRGVPPVWRALWSGDYIEAADGSGGDVSFTPPKAAGLLGERVRARFTDRYWYGGQVVGYDAEKGTHTVAFDDGDTRTDVRLDAESARGELRAEVDAARWNVGKRVRVLFADGKWWGGTTGEFDPDEGTHWVHFDDGDGRDVDLIAEAARGELRPESSSDYAATSQLHITVCMACAAVEAISAERARVGAACAPSAAAASPPWCLSLDLDFFSTRNPALRILPFDSHPSFRRALWKVASAVPIESGVLFHSALDDLLEGERAAEEVVNVILAVACGTPYEGRPSREEVEDVVAIAPELFGELPGKAASAALSSLLQAHLADHQSTEAELAQLGRVFRDVAVEVLVNTPGASREVLVARSEQYTTKRQGGSIRDEAMRILAELGSC